jgi:hypothetical protein
MDNFIFSANKADTTKQQSVVEYYTLSGNEDFFDDDQMPRLNTDSNRVYAKKTIRDNGTARYSIRLSLSNKLYDPTSQYGLDKTKSFLDSTVRSENRFKNVGPKVFDMYLVFLKTKNASWLHNAQREDE